MKSLPPHRYVAILALGCALLPIGPAFASKVQEESSPVAVLLSRARTLEQRGRLDLAKQDWSQVLLLEPNDAEALGGLVRAARAENRSGDAAQYLARLRAAHPGDPQLARLEGANSGRDTSADLAEADRLARAGDNRAAFAIYKRIYGLTPPPGAPALAYYGAEASVEGGRPQAIAGLRAFADRYPADIRYPLALGRLLLASPRTRAEGRTLLERYPGNPEAVAALHASEGTGEVASNVGDANVKKTEPAPKPPSQASSAQPVAKPLPKPSPAVPETSASVTQRPVEPSGIASAPVRTPATNPANLSSRPAFRTASAQASGPRHQAYATQEQAGFTALNQHRTTEAEQIFHEILAKDSTDPRALAGLGYLRVTTGDLKAAVGFFEQAQENGDRSLALTRALVSAQFDLALQQAATARTRGDLSGAESLYREALRERPSDPEALDGLGNLLLQSGRAEEAIPVFSRLTQVRPMSPQAWRGLVISQASAGKAAGALAADAHVPADVRSPLQGDSSYLQALATARAAAGTQVAATELPVPRPSTPQQAPHPASGAALAPTVQPPAPQPKAPVQSASERPQNPQVGRTEPAPQPRPVLPPPSPPSPPATQPSVAVVEPPKRPTPLPKPPPPVAASGKAPSRPSPRGATPATAAVAAAPPVPPPPSPVLSAPVQPSRTEDAIAAERTSQGDDALLHGENARAADLYREAVHRGSNTSGAWKGLVRALHAEGRNGDAADTLREIPASARSILDRDATFQMVAGEVYLADERPEEALHAYARAQTVFGSQKLPPPLDLMLRVSTLLAARSDDANLYRELLYLGDRRDLNDAQRREVQMIWTGWAVRRARTLAAAGEKQRAVTVLNAAAEAFAANSTVLSAVADGYAGVGLPKEAVALYKTRDLSNATAHEIEAAIRVGIAAYDFRTAGSWARLGRDRFPNDPEMLTAMAELEQARGREGRAVDLSRQAKALAPAQDPGQVLTAELREARAGHGWRTEPAGKLAVLLAAPDAASMAANGQTARPYLPGGADVTANQNSAAEIPYLLGYDEPSR